MRVILDTNVVVSGVFFGGMPGRILSAWSAGKFALVLSPDILEEYRRVGHELGRQRPSIGAAFEPLLTLIAMNAIIVDARPLAVPVSDDPDDDKFLAVAAASQTPLIVSGDGDLLRVTGGRGVDVLTPRQFVDRHLAAGSSLWLVLTTALWWRPLRGRIIECGHRTTLRYASLRVLTRVT